jgi:hypothetical protein
LYAGGRRRWGKGSTQSSDTNDEAGGDSGTDLPVPQEAGPSARNNPSYPLEQTEPYRNLAVLKKQSPDDDRFQRILDEVEALLNEGREGLEGRIEVGVAEQMLYEASDLCAKAVALRYLFVSLSSNNYMMMLRFCEYYIRVNPLTTISFNVLGSPKISSISASCHIIVMGGQLEGTNK